MVRGIVLVSLALAVSKVQAVAVMAEAESGTLGTSFVLGNSSGVIFISSTNNNAASTPGFSGRVATYIVTFPEAGVYDLYAHIRTGPNSGNDDSFLYGKGFGTKSPTAAADWVVCNNLFNVGYTNPTDIVTSGGTTLSNTWKWINVSEFNGGATPISFTVPAGNLTQIFQIGGREDGLDLDKFVFGRFDNTFTVAELDAGFQLAAVPESMITSQDGSGTALISVARQSGFTNAITLYATNLPAGIAASFSQQPATSNSVMTLTVSNSIPIGHYNITVVGSNGGAVSATPMLLMVTSNSVSPFSWPGYNPDLNYNFTNEFPAIQPPTNVLNDCSGVTTTITLSNNWFCFRFGAGRHSLVTSNAWIPMLIKLNSDFEYFRNVMGWPPDKRAKNGYFSAVYLFGSGTCVGGASNDLGGWQGSINYNGQDWPMGLFSYYPVYSWDPTCPYGDRVAQQEACTHEMIHSVLADMPGCKQAAWFQEGGNTWLQGEATARQTGNYSGMGFLTGGSVIAPFMPVECYSGWLQDDSFGGPSAEGVNMFSNSTQICTWRNLLGGVQYSEAFPRFMGEIVSQGSVAWVWRYCTNRVLEGLATAPGGLGDGQTRRLIMEYRTRAAMCDYGKWSNAYMALLNNNWGGTIDQEWSPYWIDCPAWTARCYVVTTNIAGTLTPERRTLPGWSGANQIPLTVGGATGSVASVTFAPLGNNMTCQLVYRAADNSIVYGKPVSGGTCSIKFDKPPKNNVVIAVVCNTDWLYLGEYSRTNKFDYRLTLGPGVVGTANIATKWYTSATTTKGTPVWDGGAAGNGTDLDTAANWNGDIVPSVVTGETAQFGGIVGGNLSLTHGGTAYAGSAGNPGINFELTSQQTGAVTIDSGGNTSALRLNNITIGDAAGAFTLGNGVNTFNITLGGSAGQTHTWQNNSTNPVTLNADVAWGLGGGGSHTLVLSGSGDWVLNNAVNNGTGGSGPVLSLTKNSQSTLTLNGPVSASGTLLFNAGTVLVNGAFTWSSIGLGNGLTLGGNGTINGGLILSSNVTLAPGTGLGRLTISNNVTLGVGSITVMEFSKSPLTNDQLRVAGTLTYGGTLAVTNLGPALQGGDSFQLFSAGAYAGSFAAMNLPPLTNGLAWDFDSTRGLLRVIATTPPSLSHWLSGDTVGISWPADHLGWTLLVQTNPLGIGLGTNWFTVPGSSTTNQVQIPINSANGSVFYRLINP